ncbi:hypothetical protein FNV43_RR21543 [Rhamnella rubrinervis]|uniref:Uncharacterized protein n=1 Tax=Rhamnella rubrinervis TaxID=2594499 RepID=A0A8K0E2W6_9ROSA|nr:hypothetical protein FNV43_RR21543 [Rhamnella rubrinervis]
MGAPETKRTNWDLTLQPIDIVGVDTDQEGGIGLVFSICLFDEFYALCVKTQPWNHRAKQSYCKLQALKLEANRRKVTPTVVFYWEGACMRVFKRFAISSIIRKAKVVKSAKPRKGNLVMTWCYSAEFNGRGWRKGYEKDYDPKDDSSAFENAMR